MSRVCCLHDKGEIEEFLRKDVFLHIYSLGDLDDFFWQSTSWYASKDDNEIKAIALLYTEPPLPTLHAMSRRADTMRELLRSMFHILPTRFHAHLSSGVEEVFAQGCKTESFYEFYRMGLTATQSPPLNTGIDCSNVVRLGNNDLDELLELYEQAYPGNWFNPRMLETGQYYGVKVKDKLISVAGVHVYSPENKVAALGNIATHPDYRGNGYAATATAKLCHVLSEEVDYIGLNVKADNTAAVSLYKKLGFEILRPYYECTVSIGY